MNMTIFSAISRSWVLYAFLLMFILGQPWAFPDGKPACNNGGALASKVNINMCHTDAILTLAVKEFRFLIAFILAGAYILVNIVLY